MFNYDRLEVSVGNERDVLQSLVNTFFIDRGYCNSVRGKLNNMAFLLFRFVGNDLQCDEFFRSFQANAPFLFGVCDKVCRKNINITVSAFVFNTPRRVGTNGSVVHILHFSFGFSVIFDKIEIVYFDLVTICRKVLLSPRFKFFCLLLLFFRERRIPDFGDIRFFLQFNTEEVVFFQSESEFVTRHSRALDELIVRNDLPVVPDDRDKASFCVFGIVLHRNVKPHVRGKFVDGFDVCSENIGDDFGFDHAPVAPDEKLLSCRKIRIFGDNFRRVRQG